MILMIRADSRDVYVGLWQDSSEKATESWEAGRELSGQILSVIEKLCDQAGIDWQGLTAIVVYEGPGSYTGLRISMSVVNALGSSYGLPVIGASGDNWRQDGLEKLQDKKGFTPVTPVYGGEVFTTKPRK